METCNYYLIYGASMAQVLEKFTRLTGRMPVPPRWSLGYLGSTMAYTGYGRCAGATTGLR
ncbi:MAG UNVERIFIED_CONTAM: hypothetical protein LVT10_05290 [Anaerolineae bacterium]